MQLHTQLLRAIMFAEAVAIPDIFFFINPELFRIVESTHPTDVALKKLFLEALALGIIRPTMRLRDIGSFSNNLKRAEKDGSIGIIKGAQAFAGVLDDVVRHGDYIFENWPTDDYNGGLGPQSFYRAVCFYRDSPAIKPNQQLSNDIDDALSHAMNIRQDALARSAVYDFISLKYTRDRYVDLETLLAHCDVGRRQACQETLTFFSDAYHQSQAVRLSAHLQTPGFEAPSAGIIQVVTTNHMSSTGEYADCREVPLLNTKQLLSIPTSALIAARKTDEANAYFAALKALGPSSSANAAEALAECTYQYLKRISLAFLRASGMPLPTGIQIFASSFSKLRDLLRAESHGFGQKLAFFILDELCEKTSLVMEGAVAIVARNDALMRSLEKKREVEHISMDELKNSILRDQVTRHLPHSFTAKHELSAPGNHSV